MQLDVEESRPASAWHYYDLFDFTPVQNHNWKLTVATSATCCQSWDMFNSGNMLLPVDPRTPVASTHNTCECSGSCCSARAVTRHKAAVVCAPLHVASMLWVWPEATFISLLWERYSGNFFFCKKKGPPCVPYPPGNKRSLPDPNYHFISLFRKRYLGQLLISHKSLVAHNDHMVLVLIKLIVLCGTTKNPERFWT